MKLIEIEKQIQEKMHENPDDPEIYTLLQQLIFIFLVRKKACNNQKDAEDISFQMAADIFMRMREEKFTYIIAFVSRSHKHYVEDYYSDNGTYYVDYDVTELPESPQRSIYKQFDQILDIEYLENIKRVFDRIIDTRCKYKSNSNQRLNLYLSLVISIYKNKTFYFHLDEEEKYYLDIMKSAFYTELRNNIKEVL